MQLTRRLLAFSRQQPLDPKIVDANKLIVSMSDLLTRSLGENIALETISGAGLWKVETDVSELESALLNLAINERDAMPDGGKLTIETSNAYIWTTNIAATTRILRPANMFSSRFPTTA